MAHALEIANDGAASFAYADSVGSAWHRLGTEMDGLSDVDSILAACRGDFEVQKDELFAVNPSGKGKLPTGRSITWRDRIDVDEDGTPTGTTRQVLGIVGNDYRVIQNRMAVTLGLELASMAPDQPNIDCAGVLDDGVRFFATIPLPDVVIDPKGINDRYGRNMVVVTGHDAKQSLEIVNGFTRAVCANTVGAALRGSKRRIKIRHVGSDDISVVEAKAKLGLILDANEEFQLICEKMLKQKCTWATVEKLSDKLWPLKDGANQRETTNHVKRKQVIKDIWESDRASASCGNNMYAAFQTFTEYMEFNQHIVGKSTRENRAYRAVDSPGFATRVHKLAKALQSGQAVRSLGADKP